LLALFKKFTEKKCDIYFSEKNLMDCSKPKAKRDKELCINKHKIAALMSLFSSNELNRLLKPGIANDLQSTVEFLQSGEAQQFGIITEFMDSKPRFIHRCFAEYFAANWFAENYASCKNFILNHLFNSTSEVVRNIFDRILAEDMLLHGAVLNNDMEAVNELLKKEIDVNCADKGGRTALHLAATYNRAVTQTLLSVPGVDINATDGVLKWTPLRYADRMRSWMAIDSLLQAGGKADDVVFTSKKIKHHKSGQAALWECAKKGHKKLLEVMLNSGIDVNTVVRARKNLEQGNTLLHIASYYGQVEIVRFLLERSADINIRSAVNNTAMHFAAFTNSAHVITLLLDRGASVKVTNTQGSTPLHFAALSGSLEATKTLIKRRAALDRPNKMGDTPLMLAALNGRLEIVSFLIQNGSDKKLGVANKSALLAAIEGGHLDVICFLLENGADINTGNTPRGLTPLQLATWKQNLPVVKCLLERGADVNLCSRDEKRLSALHVAVLAGNLEILDYLILAGADLNIRDSKGRSPLCFALDLNKPELAIHLIRRGANVNTPDFEQCTPLHFAVYQDNLECTKCLVQFGANINHKGPRNITALSAAIEIERIRIVNILVENYADINLRDDLGNTALHVAVGKGNLSLVHYLIDRGADINIPNNTRNTPLHWILAVGWRILVDQLLHTHRSEIVLPIYMPTIQPVVFIQHIPNLH
jgi:ankyrin repeat protein